MRQRELAGDLVRKPVRPGVSGPRGVWFTAVVAICPMLGCAGVAPPPVEQFPAGQAVAAYGIKSYAVSRDNHEGAEVALLSPENVEIGRILVVESQSVDLYLRGAPDIHVDLSRVSSGQASISSGGVERLRLAKAADGGWNIVYSNEPEKLGIGLFVISEVFRDQAFRPLLHSDIDIPYAGDSGCSDVAVIVACGTCGACIGAALAGIPPVPACVGACLACGYCAGREIADALRQYCTNQGCTGSWPNCDCGSGDCSGDGHPLI